MLTSFIVFLRPTYVKVSRRKKKQIKEGLHLTLESMTWRANSCSPEVIERCFVGSSMTQMVAGKADCSHCSIVSHNNSGVRLFWASQLTSHCVIYWTGRGLFSAWMSIDSRDQLSIITAAIDLMDTTLQDSHPEWAAAWVYINTWMQNL